MKELQASKISPRQSKDTKQAMMETIISNFKREDEIFFEHGIEEDDFIAAFIHYDLQDDPELIEMEKRLKQALAKRLMMGR